RDEPDAPQHAGAEHELRDRDDREREGRHLPGLAHLGAAQLVRLRREAAVCLGAAAVGLEDADAVHRLLDRRREVARLVLGLPRDAPEPAREAEAEERHRDRSREVDPAERSEIGRASWRERAARWEAAGAS